jgi:hypothetical protein
VRYCCGHVWKYDWRFNNVPYGKNTGPTGAPSRGNQEQKRRIQLSNDREELPDSLQLQPGIQKEGQAIGQPDSSGQNHERPIRYSAKDSTEGQSGGLDIDRY